MTTWAPSALIVSKIFGFTIVFQCEEYTYGVAYSNFGSSHSTYVLHRVSDRRFIGGCAISGQEHYNGEKTMLVFSAGKKISM
jgi:hypothetical protein